MKYQIFNEVLLNLREEFHKNGRFDDSNQKLDEMIKLLSISFYESKKETHRFNISYLTEYARKEFKDSDKIAMALKDLFKSVVSEDVFTNDDGSNIFGANPELGIRPDENLFATKLILELNKIDFASIINGDSVHGFDMINDTFGHFVRENFRNNKEDAQYMTPKEISDPIVNMIINDLKNDEIMLDKLLHDDFYIMDPTCGVGTLMIEVLRGIIHFIEVSDIEFEEKERVINKLKSTSLIGQDKVDRMVLFSKINAMLMGCNFNNINVGNSILPGSSLDKYEGKIDIIFTNPPFGAVFERDDFSSLDHYSVFKNTLKNSFSSELLLLDRSINLLRPGGYLAIVVPDSVVSTNGEIQSEIRDFLLDSCDIKAVLELPAVTFAQAGTRTKTSIIYLQRKKNEKTPIFMGVCENIGYDVKNRKGVPVKIENGKNDLEEISFQYINSIGKEYDESQILLSEPSCSLVLQSDLINNFLTPGFYSAGRIETVNQLKQAENSSDFDLRSLNELATLDSKNKKRRKLVVDDNVKHISLLHINSKEYTIDFKEVEEFHPKSKGTTCEEGEVLLAKLNPRISRMVVIPASNYNLVCSNEFEILVPNNGLTSYQLLLLLSSELVGKQIQALTSGTSSSHNRIKAEQLESILIPVPRNPELLSQFEMAALRLQEAVTNKYESQQSINSALNSYEEMIIQ